MVITSIEQLRTDAGISQRELCRAAHVHETTYSALKAGRRGGNAKTYRKLNDALDALIAAKNAGQGVVAPARPDSDQPDDQKEPEHGR